MAFIRNTDALIEGLNNKWFTNSRAKAAVQSDLDSLSSSISSEASARAAAVSAEASARAAAVSSEASSRQSADNALSGRLDVIEGSGAGSVAKALSDAEAYTDSKISALINGAPGALDTLKEIADQLANDESAVSALTNTVASNLQTAKDYADAAVLVEKNRAQNSESSLSSSISSEASA